MVVLDELHIQTGGAVKFARVPTFQKESPFVAKDTRLQNQNIRNIRADSFHRSARSSSTRRSK